MLDSQILNTFRDLLEQAQNSGELEPTSMNLATVDVEGRPHSRIVLLKQVDERGVRFYTNYDSAKGREIDANSAVALCFHWQLLGDGVQVRMEGHSLRLSADESAAYFATRPRGSQIGAWASLQSETLRDRADFEERYAQYERKFTNQDVPCPPHWGGYLVEPDRVEFWYGQHFRLHQRTRWDLQGGTWCSRLLYP